MVSDKTIHGVLGNHGKLYKQNPLEFFFFFYLKENETLICSVIVLIKS